MTAAPFVSVIVPVYRDARLRDCLAALAAQTYPSDRFEILVVDNEASPGASSYAGAVAPLRNARLLREPKPGAYAARNRAVREAKGELLAFTDADGVPAADWVAAAAAHWEPLSPFTIFAGRIDLSFQAQRPGTVELYDSTFLGFPQPVFAGEDHFAATANMICARAVFDKAGFFDEALFSAGDYEWGRRAHALGADVRYAPEVVVTHPARASLPAIIFKVRRQVGGVWMVIQRDGAARSLRERMLAEARRWRAMRPRIRGGRLFWLAAFLQGIRFMETMRLAGGGRPARR